MQRKPTQNELKELSHWLRSEVMPNANHAIWQQLLQYKLEQLLSQIIGERDKPTVYDRGYAACLRYIISKPQELITEFVIGDTADTPETKEE